MFARLTRRLVGHRRDRHVRHATARDPVQAPLGHALAFWLCLGLCSTLLAEVISSNEPLPFFSPWGLLVIVPLYTLHAVFLAGVLARLAPRLTFPALYLAGVLFGLYEAPLTKVLWSPPWEPVPLVLGDVYVVSFASLALFWHPIVAFVLPTLLAERLLTRSAWATATVPDSLTRRLRGRSRRRTLLAIVTAAAVVHGVLSPSPVTTVLGVTASVAVVVVAVVAFRRRIGPATYDVGELLPRGRRLAGVGVALAALYAVLIPVLRPEASPSVTGAVTVLATYAVVLALLFVAIRRGRDAPPTPDAWRPTIPLRLLVAAVAWFLVVAVVVRLTIAPLQPVVVLALPIAGVGIAAWTLARLVSTRSPAP